MSRRLLLLLGQNPLDPSNGAARSMDGIARMLADGGWAVRVLGTTANEFPHPDAAPALSILLESAGAQSVAEESLDAARLIRFQRKSVEYTLYDGGDWHAGLNHPDHLPRFDKLFRETLSQFQPDVLLTFGARPPDQQRQREARERGTIVVLGVRQHTYYDIRAFEPVDAVLTPSRFLSECYRKRLGIDSVAIPSPLILEEVIAPEHDPVFVTFVNPSLQKGVMFFARLAEEMGSRLPDIPLLVIESRGSAAHLMAAGKAGGFDLARHPNLMIAPAVAMPRDIYATTRILLCPSVWEEPWGRVVTEAMLNGIPPIVSGRGGLAEACAGGGIIPSFPKDLTVTSRVPPSTEAVQPWIDIIQRLCEDEAAYSAARAAALAAGRRYLPEQLYPRYLEFFDNLRRRER